MKMEQLMCMLVLFVAAASGSSPNTQTSLTVAPSGCSGFEFDGLNSKFSYTLQLDSIDQADCVRLSKFYIQNSCINTRDNQIGLDSYKDVTCADADSTDQSICQSVFTQGPSTAIVSSLTNGETFDADNVCANQNKGYVYVQSNCSSSVTLAVTFNEESYEGPVCLNIAGTQLSGWAIAIIVVAIFIALVIFSWVFWCCCCGSCCCL